MGGDGAISEILNVRMGKVQQEANVDFSDSNSELKTMEFPIGVIPTGMIKCQFNIVEYDFCQNDFDTG